MKIIAHRGIWKVESEKNSLNAILSAFKNNFGVETDIRDLAKLNITTQNDYFDLVISHDVPQINSILLESILENTNQILALNIKSDGLANSLKNLLEKYQIDNYFVFDMSVPDALSYINLGLNVFTRQSEYEKIPSFYDKAKGVWLDEFHTHFINHDLIKNHLGNGKSVCIVSSELHTHKEPEFWEEYKKIDLALNKPNNLFLCTDYPQRAQEFFNGGNND
ncbi:hypothetical protein AVBRAN12640_09530 [Campylobacter sp. RM12640]|uniref:hypothetical protein n=1 Tax=unclassified Campylobacter TaxID=2593542 RepID=UPI003014DE39|nr:hypothetical protein [Campylobacter sp. RM12640]MBZ7990025.1 hypothetical protein [Campylobacter sp. RM12635]